MKCTIIDYFEILIHSMTIAATPFCFFLKKRLN